MHLPLEQLRLQFCVESHEMSHSPPEQSTLQALSPLHDPVHWPLEQLQEPVVQESGFCAVPAGRGSGNDGRSEHEAASKNAQHR
jgi:hypothetical protein